MILYSTSAPNSRMHKLAQALDVMKIYINKNDMFNKLYSFIFKMNILNIYRGTIYANNKIYKLLEFKIISENKCIFKNVNHHCGWFIHDGDSDRITGPACIDLNQIKQGKRIIDDLNFQDIDGKEITNISKENCLNPIPNDLLTQLYNCVHKN
jgi:hypothetical protein